MTIKLEAVKKIFADRIWKSEENKNLLRIVSNDRLNIEPCCVYGLDRLGLNHLEIINLTSCIGKRLMDLSRSDIDFLNLIQEKYNCVFNFEEKQAYYEKRSKRLPEYSKLNGYVSEPQGDHWLRSSALLQLCDRYE